MSKQYIPQLDGVRAISILLILATHLLPLEPKSLQINAMTGPMGMSLFFCLSGFLITRFLYESQNLSVFFARRIARIFPLVILYAFIVAGVVFHRWDSFIGIILFYANYSDDLLFKGVSHLWSICVEFHFYIGAGIVVALFGRKGFWFIPVLAVLVLIMRIDNQAYVNIRTHLRVDEILSGSMLAIIWLNREAKLSIWLEKISVWGIWIFIPLWMLSCHSYGGALNYARPYLAMIIVCAAIYSRNKNINYVLCHPILSYIARISYSLYVWHPLFALGWFSEGGRWLLYLLKRPITFLLTFGCAHISTNYYESIFINIAKSVGFGKSAKKEPI